MSNERYDDVFNSFFSDLLGIIKPEEVVAKEFNLNAPLRTSVKDSEQSFDVLVEAPGATDEMIDVQFKDDVVTVKIDYGTEGTIRTGKYAWAHRFKGVDPAAISAKLSGGLLALTLPKKPETQATKIKIN
jgi:HSP20 family molecular chaperone IbpA